MLGRGGDDGLWMRLLGSETDDFHRCGALIIARERIAYQERVASSEMPRGLDSFSSGDEAQRGSISLTFSYLNALRASRKAGKTSFTDWLWSAATADIEHVVVHPAIDSDHGPYAAADLTVRGEKVRFGLRLAANRPAVLCALREIGGTSLAGHTTSIGPPRTDGVYVYGREERASPSMSVAYFDGNNAYIFYTNSLQNSMKALQDGSSSLTGHPYIAQDGVHLIPDKDLRVITIDDHRLIHWHSASKASTFAAAYVERTFVSNAEIAEGWGMIRAPLERAPWPPTRSAQGDLVAPSIGDR